MHVSESKQKGRNLIIILFVIALTASIVYIFNMSRENNTTTGDYPTAVAPMSSNHSDFSGWKTHTDTIYGYSFKYPQEWTLVERPIGNSPTSKFKRGMTPYMTDVASPRVDGVTTISINPEGGHNLNINPQMQTAQITLGGRDAVLYTFNPDTGFWFYNLSDDKDYPEFSITVVFKQFNRELTNQIISSFEFIKVSGSFNKGTSNTEGSGLDK